MKNLNNQSMIKGAALALALLGSGVATNAHADAVQDMIAGGKVNLNVRARYEHIDGSGPSDINGRSIRTRLGYTTGEVEGFKAMVEFEDVTFEDENDRPGLDVPTTEINQLWLSYKNEGFTSKLGNQIFVLDDHRFIGHVGWRQNIQTFDALTAAFTPSAESKVTLAYLSRVNRVNATAQDLDGYIANGSYKFSDEFNLSGFVYALDFENPAWSAMSTNTFGVRATGSFGDESIKYQYALSYANQVDAGDNTASVDLDYLAGEFSAVIDGLKLSVGYESFEGDGTRGFTTPLATVHKFNGFADIFAGRSIGLGGGLPQGLEDLYFSIGYKLPIGAGLPLTAIYHTFDSETGGDALGDEIDVVASYKLNEYTTLISKYAYYEADSANTVGYGGVDQTVFTLEANFNF